MAAAKITSANANIPVGLVGSVNAILSRIGRDLQKLVSLDNSLTATSRQLGEMAKSLQAMALDMDQRFEQLQIQAAEDEARESGGDPNLAARNRARTVQADLSDRELTSAERRLAGTLAQTAGDVEDRLDDMADTLKSVTKSVTIGLRQNDDLRQKLKNAPVRVVVQTDDGNKEKVIQGDLFNTIAEEARKNGDNPAVQRWLKELYSEASSADDLTKSIDSALSEVVDNLASLDRRLKDAQGKARNLKESFMTAVRRNTRKDISTALDIASAVGILGGLSIVLAAPGAVIPISIALVAGFGSRIVKSVGKLLGFF